MKSKEIIQKELNDVRNHNTKLYSYLYNLIYQEWSNDNKFLEKIYNSFLDDERSEIKRISIYSLLFGLKIQNDKYREFAIKYSREVNASADLRQMCILGLSEAYGESKDVQILSCFYNIYRNSKDDEDIRGACFTSLMRIMGMTSVEILRKNNDILIFSSDDVNSELFSDQIAEIEKLID